MREILFRGKRIDNGEWLEGYYGFDDNKPLIAINKANGINGYFVAAETVGQYTGLTDKNGKKIFEGDILEQVLEDDDCVIRAFIVWHGSGWAFKEKRFSPDLILSCSECEPYEIIGNIHDNPELLEEQA